MIFATVFYKKKILVPSDSAQAQSWVHLLHLIMEYCFVAQIYDLVGK